MLNNSKINIQGNEVESAFSNATSNKAERGEIPQVSEKFYIPTIEVNPFLVKIADICKTSSAINATSATIYTTPTDVDFYLTAACLSIIKDNTATSVSSYISFNVNGVSCSICRIAGLTLTPQNSVVPMDFNQHPIKVDRGAVIAINNSTNVANCSAFGTIVGFTVNNTNYARGLDTSK